ncbi:hypothetical protein VN12_04690 [Pirellula sp. SH-Sr6A]|uniref:sialate O-acetylesterase n=1 Tax=Pirellula sp. SH-Sr6A TaxID=1632865 RepID=UPI00078B3BAD|nr:sialate O-acetylesterase [Pirellula sp. SH-Sr6A]AMV31392.1 hypothetical protein VN12_04690 [Pirellula sp. SH-Sr6A]
MIRVTSVILVGLLMFASPVFSQQPLASSRMTVDVFLLGGQSNMQGVGKVKELPADVPKEIPFTFFWNNGRFEPLILGKTKTSARITDFGPGVGFALTMATANRPVYLVKYYASGMPLHQGWDGNRWVGEEPAPGRRTFYPGENDEDPNTGTLYIEMRAMFHKAISHLVQEGLAPNVRGFLWMQGEQDSKHRTSATEYASSLKRLRKRLAEDLAVSQDLPLVFGQVLPHEPPLDRFTHRREIRASMSACASDSGEPESMKNTAMVPTDGFSLEADTVHYDAQGQLRLGTEFAQAMRGILSDLRVD